MRWLLFAGLLLLATRAHADMFQDSSNAKLPEARNNLHVTGPNWFNVRDFGPSVGTGGDDTAAVTAAVAAASAVGGTLYFPTAQYRLTSQTTPIILDNVTLVGDGAAVKNTHGTISTQFWIYSTATPAFQLRRNVNWRGLGAYYPNQSVASPTPTVYPALFGVSNTAGQAATNVSITDFVFVNPYVLFKVDNIALGSGAGRVRIDNGMGYCVYSCFWLTNGIADTLHIGPNTYWGVGADEDAQNDPNRYLPKWTITNGEFIRVDTSGGARTSVSAIILESQIIFAYRYAVRVVSGTLNASLKPTYIDQVMTTLSIEGTGVMNGTLEVPGWIYSTDSFAGGSVGAETMPVVNCSAAPGVTRSQLTIKGTRFQYSRGSAIETSGTCLDSLRITGNQISNWGQSTTLGSYYGIKRADTGSAAVLIEGNTFRAAVGAGANQDGVLVEKVAGTVMLSNNIFRVLDTPVAVTATDAGSVFMQGNYTSGTVGSLSFSDTSTAPAKVQDVNNNWDKPAVPTVSACGTSPSTVIGNDSVGSFNAGSGVVTSCTVTFSRPKAGFPVCLVTHGFAWVKITALDSTAFTMQFSADSPNSKVYYRCDLPLIFP